MTPLLLATGLVHRRADGPAVNALDGLDFTVHRGERLALLGANGAGKTTLLLHCNGILKPHAGELRFDGAPLDYSRQGLLRLRARVGLLFQNPDDQLFSASIFEDVSFGPLNLGLSEEDARTRTEWALDRMNIADLADRPTHLLSFGQKKRAALAGVLAMRPEMLLLDEPTSGLDPAGVDELLDALDGLGAAGTALVLATHDLGLAADFADRAVVLAKGRSLAQGPARSIVADKGLLSAAGLLSRRVPRSCGVSETR